MRIVIDDKPVDALTAKQRDSFFLSKVQEEVKGRILTPVEATNAFIATTRQWFMIFGGIGLVLMVGIVIAGVVGEPRSALVFILFGLVMAGAIVLMLVLILRRRVRVFSGKLAHRSEGLMPVGTVLAIDAKGLSVGPDTFAWSMLAIDALELSKGSLPSGDTSTDVLFVERLTLALGAKSLVIDRAMTENGALLVDNAWRRLKS
jgi:hypothetical protein